jgi:hypothetical protein
VNGYEKGNGSRGCDKEKQTNINDPAYGLGLFKNDEE